MTMSITLKHQWYWIN